MKNIDLWYVVSELAGLVKSGGLADVAKALPKAFQQQGKQVAIALPAYAKIIDNHPTDVVLDTRLNHWPHTPYQVRRMNFDGVDVYLIDNEHYFNRPEMYAENNKAYPDNAERFSFFSAASLDCLSKLDIQPSIVHANDWHTGLVPLLLKVRYQHDAFYQPMRSVITIHNAVFQGNFAQHELASIQELTHLHDQRIRVGHDGISMLKAAIHYADKINAVSPNYAEELKTQLGSHGLSPDFLSRSNDLCGIVNGCDYSEWDPQHDHYLPQTYKATKASLKAGKKASKRALQNKLGLAESNVPMFGMVCRLTHQKGFHYILPILEQFLLLDVQLVIVGTGDPEIATDLEWHANLHPDKFKFVEAYDNEYAHLVEAGSDFFLMPSEFEACGLNQIYSMAYGTLPVVRAVGGLKDTVIDIDADFENATGVSFEEPTAQALLVALQRAMLFYLQDPKGYSDVQLRGMKSDFGWHIAAEEYQKMYDGALRG
jgi:starch synthase